MSHFEERVEADLKHIRDWVWQLGDNVEHALRNAKKSLVVMDEAMCYATVLGDHPINRDSRECDRLCHTFIARHLPGAGHLREMASTIRVNVGLERLGDYAVTISRGALQLGGKLPSSLASDLDLLADESLGILHQSRLAFRNGDADAATGLMQMARQVEGRMDRIYDLLAAADDQIDSHAMMSIYVVFSLFKRVADQAKNICDQTVYSVRGVAKIAKMEKVLFLDRTGSDAGQMATAIGRKYFSKVAQFNTATPGGKHAPSDALVAFLNERGFGTEDLATEQLEALAYDVGEYTLIVSVNGDYHDYLPKIPFHSSALNWATDDAGAGADLTTQYRALRTHIDELMKLVTGEYIDSD